VQHSACHFLIIEKGDSYTKGERIPLNCTDLVIGRSWKADRPDVAFDSLYVSRRHAQVIWDGAGYLIRDLASKHGTCINGTPVNPEQSHRLEGGDQIGLAGGLVIMTYKIVTDFDDRTITMTHLFSKAVEAFEINLDTREVCIEGIPLKFFGKERDLLFTLYRCPNKAVSYDEIKKELWPERLLDGGSVPDVENSEVTALIYRLRKRLGKYGSRIVTVARYGVFLKTD